MSASDKVIKVGLVGLGRSGWNIHRPALEQLPDRFKIVAVCDMDLNRQKEAVDKLKCRAYSDYKEFLKDNEVELAIITMPSHLHKQFTIDALNAGKAVICEKPMAVNVREADEMIKTARKTGKFLTIFQNLRYSPEFVKIREVINSGKLGRIILIHMSSNRFLRRWDWQTLKEYGGGNLSNTGPHLLDQALQLLGEGKPEVFCDLQRTITSGDADDHVKLILKAKNAPMIDIEISNACVYPQEQWNIMGTQGGLAGDSSKLRWKYFNPEEFPPKPLDRKSTPDRSYNNETYPWKEETWTLQGSYRPGNLDFYMDVYKSVKEGAPVAITPESVRRQIALIEKCKKLSPV